MRCLVSKGEHLLRPCRKLNGSRNRSGRHVDIWSQYLHEPGAIPGAAHAHEAETQAQAETQAETLLMANAYASHTELMDRLGISIGDDREGTLAAVIEAASRWIDRQCGRRFYAVSETRYYTLTDPHQGGTTLKVDDCLGVTSLLTDNNGDGVFETTWTTGTDYYLQPRNAPLDSLPYTNITRTSLTGRFYFPAYQEAIQVTGSFGYSTLANRPLPIRELCLDIAVLMAGYSTVVGSTTSATTSSSSSSSGSDLIIPGLSSYRIGQELEVKMADPAAFTTA